MTTTQLRIRVPAARAKKVRRILERLGTDTTTTINMLFAQIELRKGLPFKVEQTDPETEELMADPKALAAIRAAKSSKGGRRYTMEEVFD
ncbi:XRE family transcriptional regulator [Opitutaceae bacterium TAV5]|nr:XRE family transcriptional regulator [Opitutaceae bacterium TAV5]